MLLKKIVDKGKTEKKKTPHNAQGKSGYLLKFLKDAASIE